MTLPLGDFQPAQMQTLNDFMVRDIVSRAGTADGTVEQPSLPDRKRFMQWPDKFPR
jgi:hypothetical protein